MGVSLSTVKSNLNTSTNNVVYKLFVFLTGQKVGRRLYSVGIFMLLTVKFASFSGAECLVFHAVVSKAVVNGARKGKQ